VLRLLRVVGACSLVGRPGCTAAGDAGQQAAKQAPPRAQGGAGAEGLAAGAAALLQLAPEETVGGAGAGAGMAAHREPNAGACAV